MVQYGIVRFSTIQYGTVRFSTNEFGTDTVRFETCTVKYGAVRYGYGTVRYGYGRFGYDEKFGGRRVRELLFTIKSVLKQCIFTIQMYKNKYLVNKVYFREFRPFVYYKLNLIYKTMLKIRLSNLGNI